MFSRFPLHIEQAGLRSRPWVTNAILGLCALAFAATWLVPDDPIGVPASDIAVVVTHWADNPGTTLRPEFIDRFVSRGALQRATRTRAALEQDPRRERKDRAEAQALLDEQSQRALTMQDESPLYRHALVPSRADRPVAWLAHLFLHLGWLHLLVNLFLVFLVAPTLEDVWGRRLFSAFYVLAGLAAAAVQVLSDRAWTGMILGASGAIAGCMGALACLWVQRRVRTLGVRLWAGTLVVPAWPAGVLWLLAGLWSAWSLAGGVMAAIAHLAGFCFGALAAFALTRLGLGAEELGGPRRSQAGGAGFFAATPPRGSGLYDSPGYAGPRFLTQPQPPA
ncbi:MAG: rhomboid family intramembrane serine protease, partial [Deltaproteobacteria bacterium]|nr:rhomboid family intramembrane serine protease [Deltaproteobacteria bacterium]